MRAAKKWGVKPSDLGMCQPGDDLVYMAAWVNVESSMMAWEEQEAERNRK